MQCSEIVFFLFIVLHFKSLQWIWIFPSMQSGEWCVGDCGLHRPDRQQSGLQVIIKYWTEQGCLVCHANVKSFPHSLFLPSRPFSTFSFFPLFIIISCFYSFLGGYGTMICIKVKLTDKMYGKYTFSDNDVF